MIKVERTFNTKLKTDVQTYKSVSISPYSIPNSDASELFIKYHNIYKFNIPRSKIIFGNPDCYYKGEHRYGLYHFVAKLNNKTQEFILWTDPKTAGKGSSIELIKTSDMTFVEPIFNWLIEQYKE